MKIIGLIKKPESQSPNVCHLLYQHDPSAPQTSLQIPFWHPLVSHVSIVLPHDHDQQQTRITKSFLRIMNKRYLEAISDIKFTHLTLSIRSFSTPNFPP